MKKTIFALTAAALLMAFTACDKNNGSNGGDGVPATISGVIERMPNEAESYVLNISIDGARDKVIETCAVAADGSFTFSLPETVTSEYYDELENYIKAGLDISNLNAKIWSLYIVLTGDGVEVDQVLLSKYSITETSAELAQARLTYSDSDFTITGSGEIDKENDSSANMSFVKGWNWTVINVTIASDINYKFTTKLPSGMRWMLLRNLPGI